MLHFVRTYIYDVWVFEQNSQQQYAFGFQSLVAGDWYLACAPSSEDAQGSGTCLPGSGTCLPGSGTFGTLSPIIVFLSMVHQGFGASSGFRDSWTFVSLHCVSSGSGLVSRVPGLLELCLPSLFLFCGPSGRGTSSGFRDSWTFVSHHCVFSCGLSGLRDFWNLVSHHCVCSVVHQGAGLHQGSGILGLLFPIIVFLLVPGLVSRVPGLVSRVPGLVSRVPGLLEPCLPSLCFFLWFIRAPGFLEICLPSLCLFCGPSGRGTSSGFRDSWTFVSHHCVFSCSGLVSRAPGFLEPCLPSLCLFCGPSGRGTSSGFRDSWTFVSHHCVSSGSGTCLPSSRTCLPGSGTCGTLSPIIVFFFLWFMRAPGFLEIPNSRACWVSISRAGAGSRGLAAFKIRNGTLEPWNPGTLDLGTLEPWNPGTLGTLEPWNAGTLQPWNPEP